MLLLMGLWLLLLMVWFCCLLLLLKPPLTVGHFGVLAVGLHRIDVTLWFVRRTLLSEHQVLENREKIIAIISAFIFLSYQYNSVISEGEVSRALGPKAHDTGSSKQGYQRPQKFVKKKILSLYAIE